MAPAARSPSALPPLRFERVVLEKVWGGRRLERLLGLDLPAGRPIGESWEVSDRDDHPSVVASGPLAGTPLRDLLRERGPEILGRTRPTPSGRFPLLVKFLDASLSLSLQVHPRTSRPTGGEEAKIEAWLFLDADRESRVWLGFAPGVRPEQVEAAAGTSALVPLVRPWPARTGECVLVRGGTVHAIGAGIALLEVQENSDTTHRLYDWDRPGLDGRPRAMHVGPGLRAIDWDRAAEGPHAPVARAVPGGHRAPLVDCSLFSMERLDVEGAQEDDTGGLALLLAVLSGRGRLRTEAGDADLAPGDVWLLPASIGRHRVESSAGKLSAVRIGTKP